jgi:hypothetical protein
MRTSQTLLLHVTFLVASLSIHAQLIRPFSNGIRPAAEKVLTAYAEQFSSIQGDTISYTDQVAVFASTVKPDGALSCTLTKYLQSNAGDYAWQAVMLRSEDFDVAVKKYNACYQQLKNMQFRTGSQSCKMDGSYQEPNSTKNFYSTLFHPATDDDQIKKVRLEILLESDLTEWTVSILVYDKDHEDTEGSIQQ